MRSKDNPKVYYSLTRSKAPFNTGNVLNAGTNISALTMNVVGVTATGNKGNDLFDIKIINDPFIAEEIGFQLVNENVYSTVKCRGPSILDKLQITAATTFIQFH